MRYLKIAASVGLLALFMVLGGTAAHAQVRVGVGIGPVGVGVGPAYGPPACTYGYYDYYPYACAPYGYYSPDYFYDGVFIGVGPWFGWGWGHGWPHGFREGFFRDRGFFGRPGFGRGFYGTRLPG